MNQLTVFLCGAGFGFFLTLGLTISVFPHTSTECIQHNAAHYDPQTGAFTWNQ